MRRSLTIAPPVVPNSAGLRSTAMRCAFGAVLLGCAAAGIPPAQVVMPPTGYYAPPGYYMLLIMDDEGIPSIAKFIHLD